MGSWVQKGLGLFNSLLENLERGQVQLDLADGQLDEHTRDLGGQFLATELLHEVEDNLSNLLLEVWGLFLDLWQDIFG